MIIDLAGKTAIVTGSTNGIGFAIAKGLADAGATVVLNGRTPEAIEASIARLKQAFPEAIARGVAADLASAEG
jgi:NAD(P)-dependent dehydrogenase (short-subunit alcohol dehydrogenase family)